MHIETFIYKFYTLKEQSLRTYMEIYTENNIIYESSFIVNQEFIISYSDINTRSFVFKTNNSEKVIQLDYSISNYSDLNDTNLNSTKISPYIAFKNNNITLNNFKYLAFNKNLWDSYWHYPYTYNNIR